MWMLKLNNNREKTENRKEFEPQRQCNKELKGLRETPVKVSES